MKNKLIVTALILVATMCVSLMSGCWVDSARIEFVKEPAKTYYVGDSISDFSIRDMDSKAEYYYIGNEDLITIEGFETATPGTYTAKVTFGDYTLNFDYTVIGTETGFAGGNGSLTAPYQIATPAQFQEMLNEGSKGATKYYELISDIDMASVAHINQPTNFTGKINGNNYKVENVNNVYVKGLPAAKHTELFGDYLGEFELKNITIGFAASGNSASLGLIGSVVNGSNATFENVTTNGFIDVAKMAPSAMGVYIKQVGRSQESNSVYTLRNCTNNVDIYNSSAVTFVGGFIGQTYGGVTIEVLMDNCDNHGDIEGAINTAAGIANLRDVTLKSGANSILSNCENTGVIWQIGTGVSEQLVSYGDSTASKHYGAFDTLNKSADSAKGSVNKDADKGKIEKINATTVKVSRITARVLKLKVIIILSGSYVDGGDGHLRAVQIIDVNAQEGVQEVTIPYTVLGTNVAGYDKETAEAEAAAEGYQTVRVGLFENKLYFDYTDMFEKINSSASVVVYGLGENNKVVWSGAQKLAIR